MDLSIAEARRGWSVLGDIGASVQRMPKGGWSVLGDMGTSVQRMPRRVAMFGCIIPAPLLMPARKVVPGEEGRVNVWERSLGKVSVVQMAWAVES